MSKPGRQGTEDDLLDWGTLTQRTPSFSALNCSFLDLATREDPETFWPHFFKLDNATLLQELGSDDHNLFGALAAKPCHHPRLHSFISERITFLDNLPLFNCVLAILRATPNDDRLARSLIEPFGQAKTQALRLAHPHEIPRLISVCWGEIVGSKAGEILHILCSEDRGEKVDERIKAFLQVAPANFKVDLAILEHVRSMALAWSRALDHLEAANQKIKD